MAIPGSGKWDLWSNKSRRKRAARATYFVTATAPVTRSTSSSPTFTLENA